MSKKKWLQITIAWMLLGILGAGAMPVKAEEDESCPEAVIAERDLGNQADSLNKARSIEQITKVSARISKRLQWTDENTGDARVTLQYGADSGEVLGTRDMNVILIQDKSGSMDSNYAMKCALTERNLSVSDAEAVTWYPIRNNTEEAESAEAVVLDSSYTTKLNQYENGFNRGSLNADDVYFNSTCQMDDHYYLWTAAAGQFQKGSFVHGRNFYNILNTDYHHYRMLAGRTEAVRYMKQGRRVVSASVFYDKTGKVQERDDVCYFLDISKIAEINGSNYLSVVDTECEKNDRLAKSCQFMHSLVSEMSLLNSENHIAYIPFWGDVPEDGRWVNSWSNNTADQIVNDPSKMTECAGASYIGLTPVSGVTEIRN